MKKIMFLLMCFFFSIAGMAQGLSVSGKVIDKNGDPIPGVNISWKGTAQGTVTDVNGNYSLTTEQLSATMVVSFIGYITQELVIQNSRQLNITMQEETLGLDEVVVIGYGSQRKESVVAAISTISADEIVQSPTANLTTGLAGKMPGLTIMIKDGELGKENAQTLIRGQATTNNASPLILVDGVEREISTLDAYDIESISILKDASATAVFGVRGANGVILVTSKKGKVGKPVVSANVNYSMQTPTRLPKPMGAVDYMRTRNSVIEQHNEATGGSTQLPYGDEIFEHYKNGYLPEFYVDRNFYDEFLYDFVPMYKGNVNMQGGNEKTKYFASVGYMRQGGPFKTERWDEYDYDNEQRLNRFTYRANIDMQINKTLKGWLNLSGHLQDKNDPIIFGDSNDAATTGSFYYLQMAALADYNALAFPDLNSDGNVVSTDGSARTPYGNLNRTGYRVTTDNTINTTLGLEQDLDMVTKGLSARAIVSYDASADHIRGFRRTYQTYNADLGTSVAGNDSVTYTPGAGTDVELIPVLTQRYNTNFDLEASLNYKRGFGAHEVTGLFLYKQNQRIINADVPYNYVGIVGRATYGYDKRYLGEFNFGMNGSEQFASGRRFGFFPSLSLGWVLSEENFMNSVGVLEFLKFRGSFGQVGNDKMLDVRFIYVDDWTQDNKEYFQGVAGIPGLPNPVYENRIPNKMVTWEVSNKYNLGFESQFKGGIEWDVDVFYEKRNSILIITSATPSFMFGQRNLPPTNDGVMTNKGFETTLGYSKQVNSDLFLSGRFSASFARNEREKMNETPLDDTYAYPYRVEGSSRGTLWGYDNLGYFNSVEEIAGWADQVQLGTSHPGDLKYRDVNGDGFITEKDLVPMNFPDVPELNFSLSLSANYKGFDFSVLLHTVGNYSFDFSGRGIYDWDGNAYDSKKNYFELHKYAWTPEKAANGGDIRYPRMYPDGVTVSKQPSDYWIIDLWYTRIKNMELGYTLPKYWTEPIGLKKLRVYFNGSNLATFDNMPFKYFDPEVTNSLSHPIFATYNLGLNVTF